MDPILLVALVAGLPIVVLVSATLFGPKIRDDVPVGDRPWRETLTQRGFRSRAGSDDTPERWHGNIDGVDVVVSVTKPGDVWIREVEATIAGSSRGGVTIAPSTGVGFSKLPDGFRTGDDAFDSLLTFSGPPDVVPALLGREARGALEQCAVHTGFRVEGGTANAWLDGTDDVYPLCVDLARAARTLSMSGPIEERLAAIAQQDDEPQPLRMRCLHLLLKEHGSTEAARRVAHDASRNQADEETRYLACSVLSSFDLEPLEEFVRGTRRDHRLRERAFSELAARGAVSDELLEVVLRTADAQTASAAANLAGRERRTGLLDALRAALLEPDRAGGAAASALLSMRDYGAAPALTSAVASIGDDGDEATIVGPYVDALAELGGIDAVAALRSVRTGVGGRALRERIERAITAIQDRAGNPEAGRLAVVDEGRDDGRLSVVD